MIENQAAPRHIVLSSHDSGSELERDMLSADSDEYITRMVLQLFVVEIVANRRLKTLEGPVKLIIAWSGSPCAFQGPNNIATPGNRSGCFGVARIITC